MRKQFGRGQGFTLIEIMIVVSIVAMLASIAIPKYIQAQASAQKSACINNLKQIDGAIQQWAMDYKKQSNDSVPEPAIVVYLKNNCMPEEPAGGQYKLNTVMDTPLCTIGTVLGHTF